MRASVSARVKSFLVAGSRIAVSIPAHPSTAPDPAERATSKVDGRRNAFEEPTRRLPPPVAALAGTLLPPRRPALARGRYLVRKLLATSCVSWRWSAAASGAASKVVPFDQNDSTKKADVATSDSSSSLCMT